MNPSSKDWLKEYYIYYKRHKTLTNTQQSEANFIYDLISKSCLLFSIPLDASSFVHPDFAKWTMKEKMKVIFAEHLFQITDFYIKKNKYILDNSLIYQRLPKLLTKDEISTEKFIDQLINGKKDSLLLNTFNVNPWAFIKLIEFYYKLEKKEFDVYAIKFEIIKGMVQAAKSNQRISKNETQLIKRYIENGDFKKEDKTILYKYSRIKIFETDFSKTSKLIKKIVYDFSLLSLMTDNEIDTSELVFINQFAEVLDVSLEEQYKTFSTIQNIHLNHYKELTHLHKTYSFISIKRVVNHNFKYILKKNSGMIINEIRESKELIVLLRKSTDKKLTIEEKAKIKEQILDLLKTIPSLTIFIIPGGSILLPILIKILPQELLFPSSFINKSKE